MPRTSVRGSLGVPAAAGRGLAWTSVRLAPRMQISPWFRYRPAAVAAAWAGAAVSGSGEITAGAGASTLTSATWISRAVSAATSLGATVLKAGGQTPSSMLTRQASMPLVSS